MSFVSKRDEMKLVDLNTSLMNVVDIFASEVHRVGVIDEKKMTNIISQSDIIRFLTIHGVYIGSKLEQPIKNAGLEPIGVDSVLETVSTLDVIRFMKKKNVKCCSCCGFSWKISF